MMEWRVYGCVFAISFSCFLLLAMAQITAPSEVHELLAVKRSLLDPMNHLDNWKEGDPCTANWTGVLCFDKIGTDEYLHIRELQLLNMNLSGSLAPELGQLSHLQILDFMWNDLTGSIPKEIGNISSLKLLLLNGNKLSGSLPDELGYLPNLTRFQVDENKLTGPIPKSFSNLRSLKHLHLNNNSFSGQIPSGLSNLSNLLHMLLDNNNLSGYLPPEFSNLPGLHILQLDNNNFNEAEIPASYGNLSRLAKLSLRNCSLHGAVPDLSSIANLSYIDLSWNQLTGSIPSNKLSNNMTTIDLSNNHLNGSIPKRFSDLPSLQKLSLQNNIFIGPVPTNIWQNMFFSGTARLLLDLRNNSFSNVLGDLNPPANVTLRIWIRGGRLAVLEKSMGSTILKMLLFLRNKFIWSIRFLLSRKKLWLEGNPICSNANTKNIQQFCGSDAAWDDIPQNSTDSNRNCPIQSCPIDDYFEYVPSSPVSCFCALPLRIGYRLKSPSFSYFPPYAYSFEMYLTSSLKLDHYQLSIESYAWEKGPRLRMYLKLFPMVSDDHSSRRFNTSEILRIRDTFASWEFPPSDFFGPYELLNFTLLGPDSYVNFRTQGESTSKGILIAVVLAAIVCAVSISAVVTLLIVRRLARYQHTLSRKHSSSKLSIKIDGVKSFTFKEMALATKDFNNSSLVGQGGYGKVYEGILSDSSIVAIKRAKEGSLQGKKEFLTEIEMLSRLHHRNLVSLVGYCDEEGEQMLVYEFMPNGTLQDWLSAKSKESLHFGRRLHIALGSAKGILYLHTEAHPPIFHRDIKASNILLDSKLTAKVADFGLSRLAPVLDDEGTLPNHISTIVKGTPGYLDPEYFLTQKLTDKSDVYSLGVVFLEILTGMQPISRGKNIVREVNIACQLGTMVSIMDSRMGSYPSECVERFLVLALGCCQDKPEERPSMLDVVRELENILKLMPEIESESSESTSNYFDVSASSSSSLAYSSKDSYVSSNVSGSNLISGVIPAIRPR